MLRITIEQNPGKISLTIEGKLAGPWVAALEQSWGDLRRNSAGESLSVNLCGVSFIDTAGKALLKAIHNQGGKLVAEGCLNQAIVREIATQENDATDENAPNGSKRTPIIFYVLFFGLSMASASSLRAQTTERHSGLPASPPTRVLRLTLDQAVALALRQNTTAQIAVIQAAEAVQDKNVATALPSPRSCLAPLLPLE